MRGKPVRGLVTVAFDDAYSDTHRYAIRYLNKLNVKSTIAVPARLLGKRLENRPVVSIRELKSLVKSGHEIASHTLTHPNLLKLSLKEKNAAFSEIADSKKTLERILPVKVRSFVFPYINRNESGALRAAVKKLYGSLRLTEGHPCFNNIPLRNPYNLKGFAVMKKHPISFLNKQAGYAQKNNRWLIEVFHLVGKKNTLSAHRPKPYRFFTHVDDFKRHIDYLLSKNIRIVTQKAGIKWTTKISPRQR